MSHFSKHPVLFHLTFERRVKSFLVMKASHPTQASTNVDLWAVQYKKDDTYTGQVREVVV